MGVVQSIVLCIIYMVSALLDTSFGPYEEILISTAWRSLGVASYMPLVSIFKLFWLKNFLFLRLKKVCTTWSQIFSSSAILAGLGEIFTICKNRADNGEVT